MKIRIVVISILVCLFAGNAYSQRILSKREISKAYRQYVLAVSIYFAFGEQKTFSEDISISVLYAAGNEFGSTSHSRMLDSLAKKMLSSITVTQVDDYEGRKPILLSCIEYYESKELKKEIRKILKMPRKSEMFPPKSEQN